MQKTMEPALLEEKPFSFKWSGDLLQQQQWKLAQGHPNVLKLVLRFHSLPVWENQAEALKSSTHQTLVKVITGCCISFDFR